MNRTGRYGKQSGCGVFLAPKARVPDAVASPQTTSSSINLPSTPASLRHDVSTRCFSHPRHGVISTRSRSLTSPWKSSATTSPTPVSPARRFGHPSRVISPDPSRHSLIQRFSPRGSLLTHQSHMLGEYSLTAVDASLANREEYCEMHYETAISGTPTTTHKTCTVKFSQIRMQTRRFCSAEYGI